MVLGPKLSACALKPVRVLCKCIQGLNSLIEISGSNVIVAGTAIFGAENPEEVITNLKDAVNTAQAKIAARS